MSKPTREHVEAVGNLVGHMDCFAGPDGRDCDCGATSTAEAILTSTDPLVHAALAAALVNVGWLTEESGYRHAPFREVRRLVSEWRAEP